MKKTKKVSLADIKVRTSKLPAAKELRSLNELGGIRG